MNVQMFCPGVDDTGIEEDCRTPVMVRPGPGDFYEGLNVRFADNIPLAGGERDGEQLGAHLFRALGRNGRLRQIARVDFVVGEGGQREQAAQGEGDDLAFHGDSFRKVVE
jgi:hypothetical protein